MKRSRKFPCLLLAASLGLAEHGCNGATRSTRPPIAPASEPISPAPQIAEPIEALTVENASYEAAAQYSERRGGRALVVIEGERVALAIGQNGHPIDEPHPLFGASESFWGPLSVAAQRDALLDLDEPVALTIREWEGVRWKGDMRLRQLLQYTSGLQSGVIPLLNDDPANLYERALRLEMIAEPGTRFLYGPSHLAVFGEVLRRKLEPEGSDALAYLEQKILTPIGLEIAGWQRDSSGNLDLANGARITAREWAKFGILIRDAGRWKGAVVLDANDIEACLEPSDAQPRFGLTFWLNGSEADAAKLKRSTASQTAYHERLEDLVMAAGAGNQRLYVIPSLNLVVARFGKEDRDWRDPDFLDLIATAAAAGG